MLSVAFYLAMSVGFFLHQHSEGENSKHSKSCNLCVANHSIPHQDNASVCVFSLEVFSRVNFNYFFCPYSPDAFNFLVARAPPQAT